MGGFYSFRVYARHEVILPAYFVALDEGMNTFNVHVNEIDAFVETLRAEDVRIDAMHHLDAPEVPEDGPWPRADRALTP
jgi:hypothetical protein